ncbi:hypothetical protein [Streptomyces sp. NPDC006134]|uniref:hypothetical protein n=1 Tax=Streptomyces sp. NPDC006134 TaxID=3154467 RepID=UPI0033DE9D32
MSPCRWFVAELIAGHPPAAVTGSGRWPITDTAGHGLRGLRALHRDRHGFRRAVLPGCTGLDVAGEAVRLTHESARFAHESARLPRPWRGPAPSTRRPANAPGGALDTLAARLGATVPPVDRAVDRTTEPWTEPGEAPVPQWPQATGALGVPVMAASGGADRHRRCPFLERYRIPGLAPGVLPEEGERRARALRNGQPAGRRIRTHLPSPSSRIPPAIPVIAYE